MEYFELKENEYFIKEGCGVTDAGAELFFCEFDAVKQNSVRQFLPAVKETRLYSLPLKVFGFAVVFFASGLNFILLGLIDPEMSPVIFIGVIFIGVIFLIFVPIGIWLIVRGHRNKGRLLETGEIYPARITSATKDSYWNRAGETGSYETKYIFTYTILMPSGESSQSYTTISYTSGKHGEQKSKQALFFNAYADKKYWFVLFKNDKKSYPVRLRARQASDINNTSNAASI